MTERAIDRAVFDTQGEPSLRRLLLDGLPLPSWWHESPDYLRNRWFRVMAMVDMYTRVYEEDTDKVLATEVPFRVEVDGAAIEGRIDAVVEDQYGDLWAREYKSAARIDGPYLERLWMDQQVLIYATFGSFEGREFAGVCYDISEKTPAAMAQQTGESDEDFSERQAGMKQPGRAKQRQAASDYDYYFRQLGWYGGKPHFHREWLPITGEDRDEQRAEVSSLLAAYRECITSLDQSCWYRNRAACYKWNRACPYMPICRAHDNPVIIDAYYERGRSVDEEIDDEPIF
jgi:hypothetical protein